MTTIRYPWIGRIATALPINLAIIFALTVTVLVLSVVNAAKANPEDGTSDQDLDGHGLQIRLEMILYCICIPTVMLVATACENFCLHADQLRPQAAVLMASLSLIIWTVEFALWVPCVFNSVGKSPPMCPAGFKSYSKTTTDIGVARAATWLIIPLLLLYGLYLALAILTTLRVRQDDKSRPTAAEAYFRLRGNSSPDSPRDPRSRTENRRTRDMAEQQRLGEALSGFTVDGDIVNAKYLDDSVSPPPQKSLECSEKRKT